MAGGGGTHPATTASTISTSTSRTASTPTCTTRPGRRVEVSRRRPGRVVQVGVDAVLDVEVEIVDAVVAGCVPPPPAIGDAFHAEYGRGVVHVVDDLRKKAAWIDRGHVARVVRGAVVAVRGHVTAAQGEEAVDIHVMRDLVLEVGQRLVGLYRGIAIALVGHVTVRGLFGRV